MADIVVELDDGKRIYLYVKGREGEAVFIRPYGTTVVKRIKSWSGVAMQIAREIES